MKALGESNPHMLPPLQRAMAAYFFQFPARSTSLYYRLGVRVKAAGWVGTMATLNYDWLLARALTLADVLSMCGEQPSHGVELCLPHGICSAFVEGGPKVATVGVSMHGLAAAIGRGFPVRFITDPNEFHHRIVTDAVPPVMSYFEPSKLTMAGAHFIEAQRARFAQAANDAKEIVVIGVRVREHDAHIWQPIAASSARVTYCSGSAGGEFKTWAKRTRAGKESVDLHGRFDERFEQICAAIGV